MGPDVGPWGPKQLSRSEIIAQTFPRKSTFPQVPTKRSNSILSNTNTSTLQQFIVPLLPQFVYFMQEVCSKQCDFVGVAILRNS